MKKEIFIKRSRITAPVETVFKWHSRPGALERLSPPWDPVCVMERKGGIRKGAKVVLKMKAGPVPFKWIAEHTEYKENRLFRDRQVKGPLAQWIHTHKFEPDGPCACFLEDRIDYALRFHPFGNFFAGHNVRNKLERIFNYRHTTLARDIAAHLPMTGKSPLNVLVSGASGILGSALVPFLTTGGHRVVGLVRRKPVPEKEEIYWNPVSGHLDLNELGGIDTVVHLAGENIGQGRWTEKKKKRILESRTKGTALIARKVAELDPRPRVLVCASAIGYYGNRGDRMLTEKDGPGDDFISRVCHEWEQAAAPAIEKGIRVVFLRIGISLTPAGGAFAKLLPPFQIGIGGKIGTGRQFMSWIEADDVIGAIYHSIINENLEGPVNVVSPNPVTNLEFTETLGKAVSRRTPFSIPETAIKIAFGEMGKEILLSSTRVKPEKLLKTGYRFRNPNIEGTISHLLGKL
ncbi:TIGR01777 family oxidoreductase [Desulfonema magnum]|uniref:Epimerase, SDR39I1 family n=1 Tax=Desulfonema magnum TaxID=45655 RepID=A0A975GLU0_9BACT|nr:TIGR01777 family oxidoreductase [Desulfonema magnum]QTA86127.1 Epimerase, SDR39I1 family [Desulfonema magnum]